jgi:bifunctional non-homologous end joining protein LigD
VAPDARRTERKARLASLLNGAPNSLRYNDHQIGHGPAFHRLACERGLEGIVSKRANGRYEADRRTWLKVKCLNREEFVVVGWSDPEGQPTWFRSENYFAEPVSS